MDAVKRTRVLQIIHGLHIGGAEKVVVDLATNVDPARFEMAVCCINQPGVLAEKLEAAGIPVVSPAQRGSLRELRQIVRDLEPDVVHTHGTAAMLHVGPLYLYNRLPPWVHTFHFGNYPNVKARYLWGERLFSRRAARLVAVAEVQRKTIIRCHRLRPDAIQTILNGVNANPFGDDPNVRRRKRAEFGYSDQDLVVGCVAVLSEQKGVTYLLEAVRRMVEQEPRVKVFIAGGGPLKESLERQSTELGLDDVVRFAGWRNDALELMHMMDVFVMPSLWEAFSIVLLEAMAARRAMVVTEVGDNGTVIKHGDTGLLIPPRDSQALAEAVLSCLRDPQAARAMGERAGQYFAENLTVRQMARNYEDLYLSLVASPAVGYSAARV